MNLSLVKNIFLWQQFYILLEEMLVSLFSKEPSAQKIRYTRWSRLRRIYSFLKRSKKRRKQEEKRKQQQKRSEKENKKRFQRRKRWRKFKVVIRSFFRKRKKSKKEIELQKRRVYLKKWRKRRRHRRLRVIMKGLFKESQRSIKKKERLAVKKKEKAYARYRQKRIYRFILRRNIKIIGDVFMGKGLPKKRRQSGPSVWRQVWYPKQLTITANSLMFFLLSYFFIAFFDKLGMAVTSLLFDYKTVIYYHKIVFLVDYDAWYADSVKTIFATGPIIGLLIGVLSMILYSIVYLESGILKILLLWAIFHGFNGIINGALIGSMIGKGFGYVVMYLYYSDTGKLIMSLMAVTLAVIIGSVSTKYWIMSANSYYNYSKPRNRQLFMYSQVLLPYIFGNIIIYFINQPEIQAYDIMVSLAMISMVLPPLFLNGSHQEYYFDEEPKTIKLSVRVLLFTIVFIGVYRILLDIGLRIG